MEETSPHKFSTLKVDFTAENSLKVTGPCEKKILWMA